MKYVPLGKTTGLKVSELCFGVLSMGPLQANLNPKEGGLLLKKAYEKGINFIDTAELYGTYPHIRESLQGIKEEDVIIASKSLASEYKDMEQSVTDCLKALGRSYIDIFHLHSAKSEADVFEKKSGALQCLLDYKEKGLIRAVGISTHNVDVVKAAALVPEIDIVYPIINKAGLGIINGTTEDMLQAIRLCKKHDKGLYAMKVLGGGTLLHSYQEALDFARGIDGMDSISIGMINEKELHLNLTYFNDLPIKESMLPECVSGKKVVILQNICKKCGKCITACPNNAITITNDIVTVDESRCLLCGYCHPACPEFGIRII